MSRVLIVEDEEAIADLEKDYLELSGFTVEIENNGTAGLKRALSEEFDMFILDLMLPGTDGFEICKKIREEKNTPILMVSAKKDDIDKIRGLGLGADDYITKPFNPVEVLARVKSQLRRFLQLGAAVKAPSELTVGGIALDHDAKRVTLDGEPIAPARVRLLRKGKETAELSVTIHEGKNRQIRRMCAAVGLHVKRLRRVREHTLSLGALPEGGWRELTADEVRAFEQEK